MMMAVLLLIGCEAAAGGKGQGSSKLAPSLVWKRETRQSAYSFALAPDGKVVALLGTECPNEEWPNIRLMSLDDGQIRASFVQCSPDYAGSRAAFSPDGKFLAVGAYTSVSVTDCPVCAPERPLVVYGLPDGTPVAQDVWGKGEVMGLAFSQDGKYLAAAGFEVWQQGAALMKAVTEDARDEQMTSEEFMQKHGEHLRLLEGQALATDVIKIFRAADWQLLWATELDCWSLTFSPDGKFLAAACGDFDEEAIRLWQVQDGKLVRLIPYNAQWGLRRLAFSPDGTWLAAAFEEAVEEAVKVWRVADGELVKELPGPASFVAFSQDGLNLLSAKYGEWSGDGNYSEGAIRLWRIGDWTLVAELPAAHRPARIYEVAVNWEKGLLVCLEGDAVSSWSISPLGGFQFLKRTSWAALPKWWELSWEESPPRLVTFSADGKQLITDSDMGPALWSAADGTFLKWVDLDADSTLHRLYPPLRCIGCIPFGRNGWVVGVGGSSESEETAYLQVWDWGRGKLVAALPTDCRGAREGLFAAAPAAGMVACKGTNKIEVWSVGKRLLMRVIRIQGGEGGGRFLSGLALSPDGRYLAVAESYVEFVDSSVTLWRVADGQLVHRPKAEGYVGEVAFSPNGKLLALPNFNRQGFYIKVVKLWDVENQRFVGAIVPEERCTKLAFSPDGQLLACWELWGPSVTLYRISDGTVAFTIPEEAGSVAFSPDGLFLAVAGSGSLSLWQLPKMN
jgi:WD40 repeat protein